MTSATADLAIDPLPAGFERWEELLAVIRRVIRLHGRGHRSALLRASADGCRRCAPRRKRRSASWRMAGDTIIGCVFIAEQADHFYLGKLAVAARASGHWHRQALAGSRRATCRSCRQAAARTADARRADRQPARLSLAGFHRDRAHRASRLRPADIGDDAQEARLSLTLTAAEQAIAAGRDGKGAAMAMRIVAESARLLGAPRLIPIASAHIDGALYHGDSGTLFAGSAGRGRRQGRRALDAQCRRARPDGLLAHPARGADALAWRGA